MYMRLLKVSIRQQPELDFATLYRERVVPVLQAVPGCRFAGLVRNPVQPDEMVSMTLWETREQAEAYARGDVFREIMTEVTEYLSETSEWKVHLSEDLILQYNHVPEEPVVKSYSVLSPGEMEKSIRSMPATMYVRIVVLTLQPERRAEFHRIFGEVIHPDLVAQPGCRCACLLEGFGESAEVLSVTFWDTREDAERYERSGGFAINLERVKHTFSRLCQWKMALEREQVARVRTSDDYLVSHYALVAGRRFQ